MAINPNILLHGATPQLGGMFRQIGQDIVADRQQKADNERANKLFGMQEKEFGQKTELFEQNKTLTEGRLQDAERDREFRSIVDGALELNRYLPSGDTAGALRAMLSRRERLIAEGRDPSEDTDLAIAALQSGDPAQIEQLKSMTGAVINEGIQKGVLTQLTQPKSTKTNLQKEAEALYPDDPAAQRDFIKTARTKPDSVQTVNTAGETEESKRMAGIRVDEYKKYQDAADAAMEQNSILDQMQNIDVETGFGADARARMAGLFNGLGLDGDSLMGTDAASVVAYKAKAGELAAEQLRKNSGAQTDSDAERIALILPRIENGQKANEFLIKAMRASNMKAIQRANFYEEYRQKNGGKLDGVKTAWRKSWGETPLMSANVQDQETGLPMFYYDFQKKARAANPNATQEQITKAWRKLAKGN